MENEGVPQEIGTVSDLLRFHRGIPIDGHIHMNAVMAEIDSLEKDTTKGELQQLLEDYNLLVKEVEIRDVQGYYRPGQIVIIADLGENQTDYYIYVQDDTVIGGYVDMGEVVSEEDISKVLGVEVIYPDNDAEGTHFI